MSSSSSTAKIKDLLLIEESTMVEANPWGGEKRIEWVLPNGLLHRIHGPARQFFHENGEVKQEEYWVHGKLHCEHGPAWVNYYKMREEYHLDGKLLIFSEWELEMATRNKKI